MIIPAIDSKSDLGYLNKLLDDYNNICLCSIGKKPIHADYSALAWKTETNTKWPKFKYND